jgi:two-component system, LytTR family, sensor kinase
MIGKRDVAFVIAGWTALALAAGVQGGLDAVLLGRASTWPASFRESFLDWYSCALFIPILFVLVARWPLGRASGPPAWAAYVAVVALCTLLKFVVWVPLLHLLQPTSKLSLLQYILGDFVFQFFAFSAVVGLLLSLVYYRSFRDREMRAAHLEATLASAQLDALRVQLRPHFLFNTLNSIAALIHIDPDAADEMLGRLSELLRMTLERDGASEVTLEEELQTLDRYLAIMRVRFRDRLSVEIVVTPAARRCKVPHFILQPLLENAIEHGIDRVQGTCTVLVAGEVTDGILALSVADRGPGLTAGARADAGIGLSNARRRLETLYARAGSLELDSTTGEGLTVRVRIPARVVEAS